MISGKKMLFCPVTIHGCPYKTVDWAGPAPRGPLIKSVVPWVPSAGSQKIAVERHFVPVIFAREML